MCSEPEAILKMNKDDDEQYQGRWRKANDVYYRSEKGTSNQEVSITRKVTFNGGEPAF